ncbi:MAG: PTS sugar transporter subunit IIA [Candidatus Latescibacteria bacterium]|nr:PTS sugar transporter subunit IIA [Candidatus Latescibacterota bacterium]MBT4139861.1 PTS sugar transporter subunit IIA [Candidatus Latescibacterota bacterium]MBT5831100.1 PTS sugar transporter subunit IIA [Candidatus Latescibacterota bacterium]
MTQELIYLQESDLDTPFHIEASLMVPQLRSQDRMGAIKELVDRLYQSEHVTDSLRFLQAVLDREDLESTVLGKGVALPHARCRSVAQPSLALGISQTGIPFHTEAYPEPVYVVCMLAMPEAVPIVYLPFLAQLAELFQAAEFRKDLLACQTSAEMKHYFTRSLARVCNAHTTPSL